MMNDDWDCGHSANDHFWAAADAGALKAPEVSPGSKCPTCARRVPHPKKKTSPVTKPTSYRVPVDDVETHEATLEAWAEHWGLLDRKHWKFWMFTFAAAEALAGPARDLDAE